MSSCQPWARGNMQPGTRGDVLQNILDAQRGRFAGSLFCFPFTSADLELEVFKAKQRASARASANATDSDDSTGPEFTDDDKAAGGGNLEHWRKDTEAKVCPVRWCGGGAQVGVKWYCGLPYF